MSLTQQTGESSPVTKLIERQPSGVEMLRLRLLMTRTAGFSRVGFYPTR